MMDLIALFLSSLIGKKRGALEALTESQRKEKSLLHNVYIQVKFMLSR